MRKIPLPDEERKHAERLTEETSPGSRRGGACSSREISNADYTNNGFQDADSSENFLGSRRGGACSSRGISNADYTEEGFQDADSSENFLGSRRGGACSSRGVSNADYTEEGFHGDDSVDSLIKKSAKKSAREYAMLLVSTHTYTEKALTDKIRSKKVYTDEDISEAVEYVKGFGYVNDKRLAENSLQRLAERGYGKMKICRYLASKGISEDVIDTLDFSEIDFVYYCKRLMEKYRGKPYEKVMRALFNAGYSYDEIAEAAGQAPGGKLRR